MLLGDLGKGGLLPRGKSLLSLGDIKPQPQQQQAPQQNVNDLDLPPLFDDEDDFLKNLSNVERPKLITNNNNNSNNRENETKPNIPPRLLLSGSLTPSASSNAFKPDIVQPVPQTAKNPPVNTDDDLFSTPIPTKDTVFNDNPPITNIPPRFERKIQPPADDLMPPLPSIEQPPPSEPIRKPSPVKELPKPSNDPLVRFECNISKQLERSLNNFKRSAIRDTTSYIRYTDAVEQSVFDNFINNLISDISNIGDHKENPHPDVKTFGSRVGEILDDGIKSLRVIFDDNSRKQQQLKARKIQDYQDLNKTVDKLLTIFGDFSSNVLNEMDKAKISTQRETDEQISKTRALERMLKSMKLRGADYENRLQQQSLELESIERLLKQTEAAEKELSDTNRSNRENITNKIQNEMDKLFEIIDRDDENERLDSQMSELSKKVNDMCESIREDLNQTFLLNMEVQNAIRRSMYAEQQQIQYDRPSSYTSEIAQSMISAADRLQEKRRMKQLPSNKSAVERFHFMVENEPIENSYLF